MVSWPFLAICSKSCAIRGWQGLLASVPQDAREQAWKDISIIAAGRLRLDCWHRKALIPFQIVPTNFVSNNGLEVHWDHPSDRPHLATPTASYSLLLSLVVIPVPFPPQTSCQPYWTKGFSWPLAFELLSQPWSKSSKSMAYLAWFGIWTMVLYFHFTLPWTPTEPYLKPHCLRKLKQGQFWFVCTSLQQSFSSIQLPHLGVHRPDCKQKQS